VRGVSCAPHSSRREIRNWKLEIRGLLQFPVSNFQFLPLLKQRLEGEVPEVLEGTYVSPATAASGLLCTMGSFSIRETSIIVTPKSSTTLPRIS
jgi:hypothetical protein